MITVNKDMTLTSIVPLGSDKFGLVNVALDRGYLTTEEVSFWRDAFKQKDFSPLTPVSQRHIKEFCERNVLCFLYTLKAQEEISLMVHKNTNTGEFVEFTGTITSVYSAEVWQKPRKV